MNRHEHLSSPAHAGTSSPSDSAIDDGLSELLVEDLLPEECDASHLPSFSV